jgi:putative transposase
VILDVFSRYAVGWTVQHRETAQLAKALIGQACEQQQITRDQLTVHADRGSSMISKPVAMLLADLGATKTHSRPYTSTDNPYSEAQFKTLKYRPEFPERFDSIEQARAFCRTFFDWYNHQHRHSGIGLMTPAAVHYGRATELHAERQRVLAAAYAATPERFVQGAPKPPTLPTAAWINKPTTQEVAH